MLRAEIIADSPHIYYTLDALASASVTTNITPASGTGGALAFSSSALRGCLGRSGLMPGAAVRACSSETGNFGVTPAATTTAWLKAFTIEVVVRPLSATGYQQAVGCDVPSISSNTGHGMYVTFNGAATPRMRVFSGGTAYEAVANGALTVGTAYHLVGRYDGANVSLWVNGTKQTSEPALTADMDVAGTSWALFHGYYNHSAADYLTGELSDVAIYGVALSDSRIAAHYAATTESKSISGTSKTSTGAQADSIIIREWSRREYIKTATPSSSGAWTASVPPGEYEVLHLKSGFQPVADGPVVAV